MEIRVPGIEELPAPATAEQQQLLQVVWDAFTLGPDWPTFHWVDRRLDQQGLDAVSALQELPQGLMRGFPDRSRPVPSDDTFLPLTIAGAARCRNSSDAVLLFLALMRVLAETEQRWVSGPDGEKPSLTSATATSRLGLPPDSGTMALLQQVRCLAQYEPGVNGTHVGADNPSAWTLKVTRSIRAFRGVADIGAYWRTRSALLAPEPLDPVAPAETTVAVPDQLQRLPGPYVSEELIADLEAAITPFKLDKLLALVRELNSNYAGGHPYACQMLLRAVLDHVPPVFKQPTFDRVVANVQWSRTDKAYLKKLAEARNSADDALHRQIRTASSHLNMDDIPPRTWINALLQGVLEHLTAVQQP